MRTSNSGTDSPQSARDSIVASEACRCHSGEHFGRLTWITWMAPYRLSSATRFCRSGWQSISSNAASAIPLSKICTLVRLLIRRPGDYSDVVVVTPFGEIPWRRLSRFDDGEMKFLMIDVVQRVYDFIRELFDEERGGNLLLRLAERCPMPQWVNPE